MDMFWNIQEQALVPSLRNRGKITRYNFFLRDTLPIVLYLVAEQAVTNQPFAVTALGSGESIQFGAKEATTDDDFLFSEATWTPTGSGTTQRYVADVSLNTAALIAALGTLAYLDVTAEFTIVNTSNENLNTTQVTFRIYPDVIAGSEGVPASQYPVIAQYTDDNSVLAVRIVNSNGEAMGLFKNGAVYIFIASTGLWYPVTGSIVDGIPVIALGAGENG